MSTQRSSAMVDREPRWPILLRNAAVTGLGSGLASLPFKFFGLVPEVVVVRIFAIVTLAAAVAYAVRWEMHWEILKLYGAKGRIHVATVALEGGVTVLFVLCGPACFIWPDGGRQFVAALVLLTFIFAIAIAMAWLTNHRKLKTGTDVADYCGLVQFVRYDVLEPFEHVGIFRWLKERWDLVAPQGKVSYMTLWLCASLVTVASANAPKVGPKVYEAFTADVAVIRQSRADAPESRRAEPTVAMAATARTMAPAPPASIPALDPKYSQLCPGAGSPGMPAPQPQRAQLYRQWLGVGGLGAVFAGCAGPARPTGDGLWYAVGRCHGSVRSLAVSKPEGGGSMLLWAPARFALAQARVGSLLGATSSRLVGEGEIYTVRTTDGTYAFLRSKLNANDESPVGEPRNCGEVREGATPYLVLPPALTRLWSAWIATSGTWQWPVSEGTAPDGTRIFQFRAAYPASEEAIGRCSSHLDCELETDGAIARSQGRGPAEIAAALAHGP